MSYYKANRIDTVVSSLVRSSLQEIIERYVKSRTKEELIAELGCTPYQAGSFLNPSNPYFRDLAELCSILSLDIGITVRDLHGQEITIFPDSNFGNTPGELKAAQAIPTASTEPLTTGAWDIED